MMGSDPVPRRREAWGLLWSKAPWDGKPIEVTPVVAPAAPAGVTLMTPLADAPRSRVLARMPFGKLFQAAPWSVVPQPLPSMVDTPSTGLETTPPPAISLTVPFDPAAL